MVDKITSLEIVLKSKLDLIKPILDECDKEPPKPKSEAWKKPRKYGALSKQITGVEPAFPAWEASVLPMNHICKLL